MSEDLISNNFIDNVNKTIIKKTFVLSKVVLIFTIVYAVLELLNWYFVLSILPGTSHLTTVTFVGYRVIPVIHVILLGGSIFSWSYCAKANKMINLSFEKNDADCFNTGYRFFYKSVIVTLFLFLLAIVGVCIMLLLR